jgi:hypothetical protein
MKKYQVLIPVREASGHTVTNVYILHASSSDEALKLADVAEKCSWRIPGHVYKKPVAIPFSHEDKE